MECISPWAARGSHVKFAVVEWSRVAGTHLLPKRYVDQVDVEDAVQIDGVCDVASGVYSDSYSPATTRGAVPYLRVNNVREFVPNVTPCDLEYVIPRSDWGNRVCVAHGDVIIARTGTLGRAFVVPRSLDGAVMSQHVTRLRLRQFSSALTSRIPEFAARQGTGHSCRQRVYSTRVDS
jgi:hypothetical protein